MLRMFATLVLVGLISSPAVFAADDAKKKKKDSAPDLTKIFKQIDGSNDMKLSLDEFKNLAQSLTLPKKTPSIDYDEVFKKLDGDGDKFLSEVEFKKVMEQLPKPKKKKDNK